jgi:hypothetical protein
MKKLRVGGSAAIIIKSTFLSNAENGAAAIRKELVGDYNLHTILDLPGGVFSATGSTGVKTVVLFFDKGQPTRDIWYYQLNLERNLGKTHPLTEKDMDDFLSRYKDRSSSANSWTVDATDLSNANFDLSVKNPNEVLERQLDSPEIILSNIKSTDHDIQNLLNEILLTESSENIELLPLGELCDFNPPKKEARQSLNEDQLVTFLPMGDLGILQKYTQPIKIKRLREVIDRYTYFAENDVLLAKITPCFENGKLAIAKNLENGIGFGSSEYIVMRPKANLLSEYLLYFLSQETFRSKGKIIMTGASGHKRVPVEYVKQQKLAVPSLEEQRRIVKTLDSAFEKIDNAITLTGSSLQSLVELKKSLIGKALNGK